MKIEIRKFCSCGSKLHTRADDEQAARRIVMGWYREHTGADHKRVDTRTFNRIVAALGKVPRPARRYVIKR